MKRLWTYLLYRFRKVRLCDPPKGFVTCEEVNEKRNYLWNKTENLSK